MKKRNTSIPEHVIARASIGIYTLEMEESVDDNGNLSERIYTVFHKDLVTGENIEDYQDTQDPLKIIDSLKNITKGEERSAYQILITMLHDADIYWEAYQKGDRA